MDYILNSPRIGDVALRGMLTYIANQPLVCIKVLNRAGQVVAVSSTGLRLLKADLREIVGKTWSHFWVGESHSDAVRAVDAAFQGDRGHFTGTYYETTEPTKWRIETMPLETVGETIETIVVISTFVPDAAETLDVAAQEAAISEMMHKMANIVSAANSAGRILQRGVPQETTVQIGKGLSDMGAQAEAALAECRRVLGHIAKKPIVNH